MTKRAVIEALKAAGLYQACLQTGIIPSSVATWVDVESYYKRLRGEGIKKMHAVGLTADEFGRSERQIQTIIKELK